MKNVLLLIVLLTLVSGIASASSVFLTCTPFAGSLTYSGPNQGANSSSSCPGFSLPGGAVLTSVEVYYLADYQFAQTSNATVNTVFAAQGGFSTPNQNDPYTCVTTGTASSGSGPCTFNGNPNTPQGQFSSETAPNTSGFTVLVTATEINGSQVTNSSFANIVEFDYSTPPGTPEPASFILAGGGLLALGMLSARRKKA